MSNPRYSVLLRIAVKEAILDYADGTTDDTADNKAPAAFDVESYGLRQKWFFFSWNEASLSECIRSNLMKTELKKTSLNIAQKNFSKKLYQEEHFSV